MTELYIQMIGALVAVTGLIFLMAIILKKKQAKTGLINLLAYQPFGQRKGIAALKIGREVLIVGVTANDLRLLKTFNEDELENETITNISEKVKKLKGLRMQIDEHK